MSDLSPPVEHDDDGANDEGTELQFDQAELATPTTGGPSCDACKRPIHDAYYEINGKVLCTSCRHQIEASWRGGSGLARFFKAVVLGTGAAIAGAALYYIVQRVTGWNIGLVAIVVGFMVGGAVRKGTGNRGGMLYQFLSLFLTYIAIGLMTLSFFIEAQLTVGAKNQEQAKAIPAPVSKDAAKAKIEPKAPIVAVNEGDRAKGVVPPKQAPGTDAAAKASEAGKTPVAAAEKPKNVAVDDDEGEDEDAVLKGLPQHGLGLALVYIFIICAGPILFSISDKISGLIYCFALFQAWQMTRRAKLVFNGPFQVGKGKSTDSESEAPHDVG